LVITNKFLLDQLLIISIGVGTKLGNGCTSGHGVCGMPRFSIRSIVAVACFLPMGVLTSTLRFNEPFL
jgi:uncharacterized membrane protein YedE/YeeE